jgi:phospholipase C
MTTSDRRFPVASAGVTRREFMHGAAVTAGLAAFGGFNGRCDARAAALPPPEASGVEHIIVLMMENRSFDHFLGWLPRADGRQRGLTYVDAAGTPHPTHRLAPDFQGCGHPDPDHSYAGGRIEFNNGACDGWLRAGDNDEYSIGYYTKHDLPFFADAAKRWTVCDRYFSSIMAPTYPNRIYQHAAQTDRLTNSLALSVLPTIWDRLAGAGRHGRYYFSDVPMLALWGSRYLPIGRPFIEFLVDAHSGRLPEVAFVEPRFLGEENGTSNDDHPFADIRSGQAFVNLVCSAVTTSPAWPKTVLIINYDEWGGFFDHVPPGTAPIPEADRIAGDNEGRLGFRTPCLIVSPFTAKGDVSSLELDHTSILRMIEWRWGLPPLTVRDQTANNLAEVLDFSRPDLKAKQVRVPTGPFGGACPAGAGRAAAPDEWKALWQMAADFGWPVQGA